MKNGQEDDTFLFAGGDNIREYYQRYLSNICNLSAASVDHYLNAIQQISKFLSSKGLVKKDIYEIGSLEQIESLWDILQKDEKFILLNQRGHRMYSAGYKRYHEFVAGSNFSNYHNQIVQLDVPVLAENPTIMEYKVWKRSGILRTQIVECNDYKCEMDMQHVSFLAENTHKPYMEVHHAIPLRLQGSFKTSIDVYANLVCLCPMCHRKIHYGLKEERREMADKIYEERKERLVNSGIIIGKEDFERLFIE